MKSIVLKHFKILLLFLVLFIAGTENSFSQIVNAQGVTMDFRESKRTVITNKGSSGKSTGSVHKYTDLITIGTTKYDGFLTIVLISNATIDVFDYDFGSDNDSNLNAEVQASRFQPRIDPENNGGYVRYKVEFKDKSGNPVYLQNYNFTGIDVDGASSYQEYVEVANFNSINIPGTTQLIQGVGSVLSTRFRGKNSSDDGFIANDTSSFLVGYTNT